MTSATIDRSEFRHVLLSGTIVGVITAAAVIVYLLVARLLSPGIVASLLETVVVLAGAVAAAFLPGFFAGSRTTQGIASAAAIGLWGTIVFMAIDIILLRPFKAYPWTWDAVGGGSTWWYLPVWWMLGTFLAWMGGIVTAGQAARGAEQATLGRCALPAVAGAVVVAAIARLAGLAVSLPAATGGAFTIVVAALGLVALTRKG